MSTKKLSGELMRPGKIAGQAVLLAVLASPAYADPIKLHIACTATSDCASAMVARDEGIFAKHGIDADMTLIGINTNIPPAIVSDSIQVGGPTSPVFLQAVSGGLDLVAIEGASTMDAASDGAIAVMTRNGVTAHEAKDFVGKKVGAPGIGAFLQVLFVKWLIEKGVDPKSVNFVEVTFPTMSDALKSGAVDAVVTAEPFISRITKAGNGAVGVRYASELGRTDPIISYVTTREFAEKNPDAVKAFRASIEEAAAIVNGDHEKTAASISKFTKQPIDIVRANVFSHASPTLKGADFIWWLEVMKQQDMLQAPIDVEKLVVP
jgi:NitT/TauT family transport system substrate-binding protein